MNNLICRDLIVGWMWMDSSGTVEEQLVRAKIAFEKKFGYAPTYCDVGFEMVASERVIAGVRVIPKKGIHMGTYFMGKVEEK